MRSQLIIGVRIVDGTRREPFTGSVRVRSAIRMIMKNGDLHRAP